MKGKKEMKFALILFGIFSINLHAAESSQKCDLTVQLSRVEGESKTYVSSPRLTSSTGCEEIKYEALASCQSKGGTDCKIVELSGGYVKTWYNTWPGVYECSAVAAGMKVTGGKKLSDAEYAKRRLSLLCQKIDKCVEDALNDEKATANYIDKLYQVKNNSNCSQVENFIFQN